MSDRYSVLDFETTGLSANNGDRAIEIGLVIIENEQIIDEFSTLINPGVSVPAFITQLTGITDAEVRRAPTPKRVYPEVMKLVAGSTIVAHNASFDKGFWEREKSNLQIRENHDFLCTLLLSRRLYPYADNHKLGTLAEYHDLPSVGEHHRALADAKLTAYLLLQIIDDLDQLYESDNIDAEFLNTYQSLSKSRVRSEGDLPSKKKIVKKKTQVPSRTRRSFDASTKTISVSVSEEVDSEKVPTKTSYEAPGSKPISSHKKKDNEISWFWLIVLTIGVLLFLGNGG